VAASELLKNLGGPVNGDASNSSTTIEEKMIYRAMDGIDMMLS